MISCEALSVLYGTVPWLPALHRLSVTVLLLYTKDGRWEVCTCIGEALSIIILCVCNTAQTPVYWVLYHEVLSFTRFAQLTCVWFGMGQGGWLLPRHDSMQYVELGGGYCSTTPSSTWVEWYLLLLDSMQHMDAVFGTDQQFCVIPMIPCSDYLWCFLPALL